MPFEGGQVSLLHEGQIYTATLSGLNCVVSILSSGFVSLENPKVLTVKILGCQRRLQLSLARTVSCWTESQTTVEDGIRGLKATATAIVLEHRNMGAHECLASAVAASNARENGRGYAPQQHGLGRTPDLDGRFYKKDLARVLPASCAPKQEETTRKKDSQPTSTDARCPKARSMCVAQSRRTTHES